MGCWASVAPVPALKKLEVERAVGTLPGSPAPGPSTAADGASNKAKVVVVEQGMPSAETRAEAAGEGPSSARASPNAHLAPGPAGRDCQSRGRISAGGKLAPEMAWAPKSGGGQERLDEASQRSGWETWEGLQRGGPVDVQLFNKHSAQY